MLTLGAQIADCTMEYPIAYHITFTTYGTWLHGDKRGSVDEQRNQYRSAFMSPNAELHKKEQNNLKNPPVILDENVREIILKAVLQYATFVTGFLMLFISEVTMFIS